MMIIIIRIYAGGGGITYANTELESSETTASDSAFIP